MYEPPWLKTVLRLQRQMEPLNNAFKQLNAVRSFANMGTSSRYTSQLMRQAEQASTAKRMYESMRLASSACRDPESLKAIQDLNAQSIAARQILNQTRALDNFVQLNSVSKAALSSLKSTESFRQLQQLTTSPAFRALSRLSGSPLENIAEISNLERISPPPPGGDELSELGSEVKSELESTTDFNNLSQKTKTILLYILLHVILPVLTGCMSAYIMQNVDRAGECLKTANSKTDIKIIINSNQSTLDYQALNGFRVITKGNLDLRSHSSMKSDVIATLPLGTIVEILNSSQKSWLFVEVEINGKSMQGWVLRRYTLRFK